MNDLIIDCKTQSRGESLAYIVFQHLKDMAWFKRKEKGVVTATKEKKETPDGFWVKTPGGDVIESKELQANQFVTPKEGLPYTNWF